jgi:uncharacterized protein (TIGR04255 family)
MMNWEPAHADHSIDTVSVVIALASPIEPDVFDEVIVTGRKAAAVYQFVNRVESIDATQIQPGQQVIFAATSNIMKRRVAFQRLAEGAAIGEFSIGASSLTLTYSRYTSWTDFKNMGFDLLNAIQIAVPNFLSSIASVQLQYVDRFTSIMPQADPFEVVSKTSSMLPNGLSDKGRAFHCNSGWFDYLSEDRRKLTNVNIGLVDNSLPSPPDAKSTLTFLTLARIDQLGSSMRQPLDELTGLHDYLKVLFKGLITDEAAARVALND